MDWQVIASLVVSVGAFLAYFAMGDTAKPASQPKPASQAQRTVPAKRTVQGNYTWQPPTIRQIDDDVIDRFANALKAQSRPQG